MKFWDRKIKTEMVAKVVFALSVLLSPVLAEGQEQISYYDRAGYKVSSKDSADHYRVYRRTTDGFYSFDEIDADDSSLRASGMCVTPDSASLLGHYINYYNGHISSEGNYLNNKLDGLWKHYRDTNKLWYTDVYRNDTLVDTLTSYYKNGSLKRKQYYVNGEVKGGKCWDESGKEKKFTRFEVLPYPEYNVMSYLAANVRYPEKARRKGKEGRVLVGFIVNENGSISDVEIVRGVYPDIDNEALRVVKDMANWKPALQDDVPVKVRYTQPITFKLE